MIAMCRVRVALLGGSADTEVIAERVGRDYIVTERSYLRMLRALGGRLWDDVEVTSGPPYGEVYAAFGGRLERIG
jgi:hypothetical protein